MNRNSNAHAQFLIVNMAGLYYVGRDSGGEATWTADRTEASPYLDKASAEGTASSFPDAFVIPSQNLVVVHPRTGKVFILSEAEVSDWVDSWPTYLADRIPVSEGAGRAGSIFCFWLGNADSIPPETQRTIESFLSDHDVVGVRFVRAAPTKVHPAIAAQFEAAAKAAEQQVAEREGRLYSAEELASIVAKLLTADSGEVDSYEAFESFMTKIAEVVCDHCGGEVFQEANRDAGEWQVGVRSNNCLPEFGGIWREFGLGKVEGETYREGAATAVAPVVARFRVDGYFNEASATMRSLIEQQAPELQAALTQAFAGVLAAAEAVRDQYQSDWRAAKALVVTNGQQPDSSVSTREFYAGYVQKDGTRIQVDFEVPAGASSQEKDAAFVAELGRVADLNYLAVGDSAEACRGALDLTKQAADVNADPDGAMLFFEELLASIETLGGIVDQHGVRTLEDLMYLQQAILKGETIEVWPGETNVVKVIEALPSRVRWMSYTELADEWRQHCVRVDDPSQRS